jgi:CDP-diacylglycerol--glycerol-3-phosphate 3-phosphatidyltransferase
MVVIWIASITDDFDGTIAREQKIETKLGKFLDPVADKLLVCSVFTLFVSTGDISPWVLVLMLWREFLVLGLRMHLASEGVVLGASHWAKWKTIFQIAALVSLLMVKSLQVLAISGDLTVRWVSMIYYAQITESLVQVSLLLSVMSGLEYFIIHWDSLKRG